MFLNFEANFVNLFSSFFNYNNIVKPETKNKLTNDLNAFYLDRRHLDRLLSSSVSHETEDDINFKKIFFTELELVGLGYRISIKKSRVRLSLGYSHVIFLVIPKVISVVKRKYKILIYSKNPSVLGLFVSVLLKFKRLNPYKIKGLKQKSLSYKLKPGKRSK